MKKISEIIDDIVRASKDDTFAQRAFPITLSTYIWPAVATNRARTDDFKKYFDMHTYRLLLTTSVIGITAAFLASMISINGDTELLRRIIIGGIGFGLYMGMGLVTNAALDYEQNPSPRIK